ncbi:MAG: DMT family transporter [Kiloniellales bacterium]
MAEAAQPAAPVAADAPPASPAIPGAIPQTAPLLRHHALPHQALKGIACLIAGIAVFSLQDLVIKLVSDAYPLHQALTIRSLTALPLLLLLVHFDGGLRHLSSRRWPALIARATIMFTAYASYYLGLASLPIATCVALYFTAPLFITVLSVLVLGERVGPRRWAAVAIGFAGVLVMVRPGAEIFDWASLLPVYAGLAYGGAQILARRLGATERSSVMAFYGNGLFLVGGLALAALFGAGDFADEGHRSLAFLLRGWVMPSLPDLLLLMLCGVVAAVGLTLLTQAYRLAQANVVAPFEYTALVWGVLYGWLVWHELPGPLTWLGTVIVIGAGLYVLYRERETGAPTLWRRAGWRRLARSRPG